MRRPGVVALFVMLTLSGWQAGASEAAYSTALAEAEAARQRVADAGHEWLAIGPLLEQAAEAADAGDWETAIRLANEALLLAELGLEQAKVEAKRWQERVIRD